MPMPALATRRSRAPRPCSTSATIRSTSSRLETSATTARPPISLATCSTSSRVRAETATRIPADASSRAMLAPIPRPPPVTSAICPLRSPDGTRDLVQNVRIFERGQVPGIFPENAGANGAADDFRAASLRERGHEDDPLRLEGFAELVRDARRDLERVSRRRLVPGPEHTEDPRDLSLHIVRDSDRGRLRDRVMGDRG